MSRVKDKNGNVLIEDNEVMKESSQDLFNKETPDDTFILQMIPTIPEEEKKVMNQIFCWKKFKQPLETSRQAKPLDLTIYQLQLHRLPKGLRRSVVRMSVASHTSYGLPIRIVDLLWALYDISQSTNRVTFEMTSWSITLTGVRQGCTLPPPPRQHLARASSEVCNPRRTDGCLSSGTLHFNTLRFADDMNSWRNPKNTYNPLLQK